MTTVNEKLRALAEEIESDREEWASLAETAITAHTANERGARAAAHREDARRLRAILDAPPASPEAPAPDLTALVEAYGEAVGALHSWGGAPRQARATAAEAALLSAISRAVSEAREAGRREGIERLGFVAGHLDDLAALDDDERSIRTVRGAYEHAAEWVRALASTTRGDER